MIRASRVRARVFGPNGLFPKRMATLMLGAGPVSRSVGASLGQRRCRLHCTVGNCVVWPPHPIVSID